MSYSYDMYQGHTISCIIPCHNEAPRIADVLKAALKSKYLDEVIVVDDASTDNSVAVLLDFNSKVNLIINKVNLGKAGAVLKGIKKSTGESVFLIDADLKDLRASRIDFAIKQFVDRGLDMLLCPVFGRRFFRIYYTDMMITGQRLIKKPLLLASLPKRKLGYAIELYLNHLAEKNNWKVDAIVWEGVGHELKIQKFGLVKGIEKDFKMLSELLREKDPISLLLEFVSTIKIEKR